MTVGRAGGRGDAEERSLSQTEAHVSVCERSPGWRGCENEIRGLGRNHGQQQEGTGGRKRDQTRDCKGVAGERKTKNVGCPRATGRWRSKRRMWAGSPALAETSIGGGAKGDAGDLGKSSVREWRGPDSEEQASRGAGGEEL